MRSALRKEGSFALRNIERRAIYGYILGTDPVGYSNRGYFELIYTSKEEVTALPHQDKRSLQPSNVRADR